MKNLNGFVGLFFARLPKLEELIAVKARIRSNKNPDTISPVQPLCCRELIFTEPTALVSPLPEERQELFLITPKATFESPRFQDLLHKLNVQSYSDLRALFFFTQKVCTDALSTGWADVARIAPLWNKAGEFLVQGRDFLEEHTKLSAVTLELNITDKICIGLRAYSIKFPPCKPEHFSASCEALQNFHTNSSAVISEFSISDDRCFVLPSLKKGRILSISHNIPEDSPFETYEDLRKHWKLMYGYRLPAEENVFYNVHFYYIRGRTFAYPASCIRSTEATVSPRCDQQAIFNSFIKDLSSRFPSVCGTSLVLTSSPVYPTNQLQQAKCTTHSNLTRTAPQLNHCTPFLSVANVSHFNEKAHSTSPSLTSVPFFAQASVVPNAKRVTTPDKAFPEGRFVPSFTSGRIISTDTATTVPRSVSQSSTLGPRIVPVFKRNIESDFRRREPMKGHDHNGAARPSPVANRVQSVLNPNVSLRVNSQLKQFSGLVKDLHKSHPDVAAGAFDQNPPRKATSLGHVAKRLPPTRPGLMLTQSRDSVLSHFPSQFVNNATSGAVAHQTVGLVRIFNGKTARYEEAIAEHTHFPDQAGPIREMTGKRKVNGCNPQNGTQQKKPKTKPKLQESIDVRELAINDQLHKATAVTLTDWLKKRGVAVKSKDKKGELAIKVKQLLGITLHES